MEPEYPKVRKGELFKIGNRKVIVHSVTDLELKKRYDSLPDLEVIYHEYGDKYVKTGANWNKDGYWDFFPKNIGGIQVKSVVYPELK